MEFKDYALPETAFYIPSWAKTRDDAMDVDDAALQKESLVAAIDNMALTWNSAAAHKSTLSACLDFFYQIQANSDPDGTNELLEAAWNEDANVTLRLIFQLRDIRDGKGIRNPFLYCLLWLRRNHFQTLLYNLDSVAKVGCWKDLLELLVAEVLGTEAYGERLNNEKAKSFSVKSWVQACKTKEKAAIKRSRRTVYDSKCKIDKEEAAATARRVFTENQDYKQLHIRVASLFAEALKKDLASMKANKGVSLASKWAPTACKHHDKFTLIASTISQMLFPQKTIRKEGQTYAQYVSLARDLYRKVHLSPLRKYSNVIERFMSEDRWNEIPYDKVPSKCMLRHKSLFAEKDAERYESFLGKVKKGEKTIKSSALDPHEMIEPFISLDGAPKELSKAEETTLELQWDAYVKKLTESGALQNSMAICDVSSSMFGQPIKVSVSLSLLVATLAEPPYKNILITFSSDPELFLLPEGTLRQRVEATMGMNLGGTTDVEKAFDLILEKAMESNLSKESMIKRLFIFSDMQFNCASQNQDTNFHVVKQKFNNAGYDLPQVVFWNLAGTGPGSCPVVKHENNTALISGFSGQLLKMFMDDNLEVFTPISILMKAIESYTYLKVVD